MLLSFLTFCFVFFPLHLLLPSFFRLLFQILDKRLKLLPLVPRLQSFIVAFAILLMNDDRRMIVQKQQVFKNYF